MGLAGCATVFVLVRAAGLVGTEGGDGCEADDVVVDWGMAAAVGVDAGVTAVTPALSQGFGGEGMAQSRCLGESPRGRRWSGKQGRK